jgi:hypothetical protein
LYFVFVSTEVFTYLLQISRSELPELNEIYEQTANLARVSNSDQIELERAARFLFALPTPPINVMQKAYARI